MKATVTYGICEEIYCLGSEKRAAYGIAVFSSAEKDGVATVTRSIHDITDDREALEELVRKCNKYELDPIHLEDVVIDFIG